jgi:hypothetical protein
VVVVRKGGVYIDFPLGGWGRGVLFFVYRSRYVEIDIELFPSMFLSLPERPSMLRDFLIVNAPDFR